MSLTCADVAGHIRLRVNCTWTRAIETAQTLRCELLGGDSVASWGAVMEALLEVPDDELRRWAEEE